MNEHHKYYPSPSEAAHSRAPQVELPPRPCALDELDIVMRLIGGFGQSIQSADVKSGMLGALLGLMLAGVTGDLSMVRATLDMAGPGQHLGSALLAAFVISLVVAEVCLGLTQVPRLACPPTVRRLSFPALAHNTVLQGGVDALQLRDEAWCQARALALIAFAKFRYLQVGMIAGGICAITFISWLVFAATVPQP